MKKVHGEWIDWKAVDGSERAEMMSRRGAVGDDVRQQQHQPQQPQHQHQHHQHHHQREVRQPSHLVRNRRVRAGRAVLAELSAPDLRRGVLLCERRPERWWLRNGRRRAATDGVHTQPALPGCREGGCSKTLTVLVRLLVPLLHLQELPPRLALQRAARRVDPSLPTPGLPRREHTPRPRWGSVFGPTRTTPGNPGRRRQLRAIRTARTLAGRVQGVGVAAQPGVPVPEQAGPEGIAPDRPNFGVLFGVASDLRGHGRFPQAVLCNAAAGSSSFSPSPTSALPFPPPPPPSHFSRCPPNILPSTVRPVFLSIFHGRQPPGSEDAHRPPLPVLAGFAELFVRQHRLEASHRPEAVLDDPPFSAVLLHRGEWILQARERIELRRDPEKTRGAAISQQQLRSRDTIEGDHMGIVGLIPARRRRGRSHCRRGKRGRPRPCEPTWRDAPMRRLAVSSASEESAASEQ